MIEVLLFVLGFGTGVIGTATLALWADNNGWLD